MEMQSMRLESKRHPDEEVIEKYSLGDLSEGEVTRVEEHLLICESCQNRVTESDRYVAAMQSVSAQIRRGTPRTEDRPWYYPRLVPSLLVAAGLLFLGAVGLEWGAKWNEILHTAEPTFAINLVANRGGGIDAKAPAGRPLTLQLDLAGLPPEASFRLEMVDGVGKRVWQGAVISQGSQAVASVPKMASGTYFLRTYAPSGKLLREYGLEVESR
jgi:anti-sigma factor RsiW